MMKNCIWCPQTSTCLAFVTLNDGSCYKTLASNSASKYHYNVSQQHQQNVQLYKHHISTSQTVRLISQVLLSNYKSSQAPLQLCKLIPDAAGAFAGAPQTTCGLGGAMKTLRYSTYRIVKYWSHWVISTGLWETLRAAQSSAQVCRKL